MRSLPKSNSPEQGTPAVPQSANRQLGTQKEDSTSASGYHSSDHDFHSRSQRILDEYPAQSTSRHRMKSHPAFPATSFSSPERAERRFDIPQTPLTNSGVAETGKILASTCLRLNTGPLECPADPDGPFAEASCCTRCRAAAVDVHRIPAD